MFRLNYGNICVVHVIEFFFEVDEIFLNGCEVSDNLRNPKKIKEFFQQEWSQPLKPP